MPDTDPKNIRYLKNRNLWRKTSPYNRQKPEPVTLLDRHTDTVYTFDRTRTTRHRDIYKIIDEVGYQSSFNFDFAEYQEGTIKFNNEVLVGKTFETQFTGTPYIVLTLDASVNDYVAISVVFVDSSEFYVATSAPYDGQIYFRAVYATNYPARALSPTSGSLLVVGGKMSLSTGNQVQSSFNSSDNTYQPVTVFELYSTPVFNGDYLTDPVDSTVAINSSESVPYGTSVSTTIEVSAPLSTSTDVDYLLIL